MGPVIDATVLRPPFSGVHYAVRQEAQALLATAADAQQWHCLTRDPPLRAAALARGVAVPPLARWLDRPLLRCAWQQVMLPRLLRRWQASHLLALAGTAPRHCPVPLVLQVHDTIALRRPDLCRASNAWQMRALLPAAARQAALIIVAASAVADELRQLLGLTAKRIEVVPLGLDDEFIQAAAGASPPPLPLPVRDLGPYLLFVGGSEARKGLASLLAALAPNFPWPLIQVGPLLPGGLGTYGRSLGYVPRADLPGLYAHAALTIVPSLEEGFSLPVLEALACGGRVLHRDHPVLRQTAGGRGLEFASGPGEVSALRRALEGAVAEGFDPPSARWAASASQRAWAASHTPARWAASVLACLP